jgi:hypothetical protein
MADNADDNLSGLGVGQIKHAVVADANTKAVATFQFFAAVRKRIFSQRENGFGDTGLELRRKPGEFLACIAGDFNLPDHTLIFNSFNAWRNDWRG